MYYSKQWEKLWKIAHRSVASLMYRTLSGESI